jgi:hypothetical protein
MGSSPCHERVLPYGRKEPILDDHLNHSENVSSLAGFTMDTAERTTSLSVIYSMWLDCNRLRYT